MSVKRFTAPDMRRALELVSREMGPDAIILSSQRTANGVEIITSLELDQPGRDVDKRKAFSENFDQEMDQPLASDQAWQVQQGLEKTASKFKNTAITGSDEKRKSALAQEIEHARARMIAAKQAGQQVAPSANIERAMAEFEGKIEQNKRSREAEKERARIEAARQKNESERDNKRLDELQNELADMRLLLEEQMWRMTQSQTTLGDAQPKPSNATVARLQTQLERIGLPNRMVTNLSRTARNGERLNESLRRALGLLAKKLPVDVSDKVEQGGVFAFVGSTGVGKTTTIAKLAARYVLKHGVGKVALVATDSYRVGAHDQLRALGRILGVPVRVVDKTQSLLPVLQGLKNYPLVLVDTAGFRFGDQNLKEQEAMLDACPSLQKIIVLASNSQAPALRSSIHAHCHGRVAGCVLSKLDESASLGEAMHLLIEQNLPLMYTTDGQDIPSDLQVASPGGLVAKAVNLAKSFETHSELAAG